jgi:peptidoglycan/xylan/chitin deacetylase (PgdA/CDA1 family)
MKYTAILTLCLLITPQASVASDEFLWPQGAKGAVCLTYDDALDSHLDSAVPDLEAASLSGTFYVTGNSDSVRRRLDEWRDLARRGHELGNHSLFHPCVGGSSEQRREWVRPERDLRSYTVRRMIEELSAANTLLTALDGRRERSYAYTCADELAGGSSYVAALGPLFSYARSGRDPFFTPEPDGRDEIVTDLRSLDLYRVPSRMVVDRSAEEMIAFVEQAVESGGLAVLMFHGIGGDYLTVSRREHQRLLEFLDENRHRLWTNTFSNVLKHVEKERKRLGW